MPYEWIDGIQLYMDYETESEKKLKEYRRDWQRKKRANKPIKKRIKQPIKLEKKFICPCGGGWTFKTNKSKHYQSKRHIKYAKDLISDKKLKPEIDEYI